MLFQLNCRANSQQAKIYEYMKNHPGEAFTGYDIQRLLLPNSPRTSAGRALTNLQQAGWIKVVGEREEQYGVVNFLYAYEA